jgi:hypothetical protein
MERSEETSRMEIKAPGYITRILLFVPGQDNVYPVKLEVNKYKYRHRIWRPMR